MRNSGSVKACTLYTVIPNARRNQKQTTVARRWARSLRLRRRPQLVLNQPSWCQAYRFPSAADCFTCSCYGNEALLRRLLWLGALLNIFDDVADRLQFLGIFIGNLD